METTTSSVSSQTTNFCRSASICESRFVKKVDDAFFSYSNGPVSISGQPIETILPDPGTPIQKPFVSASFGCVIPDYDCIYLVADTLCPVEMRGEMLMGTTDKVFTFPGSNVGCLSVGQLAFGEEHIRTPRLAEQLSVSDATDAAYKLTDIISKYELHSPVYGFTVDTNSIVSFSLDPNTGKNYSDAPLIKSAEHGGIHFLGARWAVDAARYVPVSTPRLRWGVELVRSIIKMDSLRPDKKRTIGGLLQVVKVFKDSADSQILLP